jgi:hypothetical protein
VFSSPSPVESPLFDSQVEGIHSEGAKVFFRVGEGAFFFEKVKKLNK